MSHCIYISCGYCEPSRFYGAGVYTLLDKFPRFLLGEKQDLASNWLKDLQILSQLG